MRTHTCTECNSFLGMDWKILQEVIHTIEDLNRRLANRSSAVLRCVDTYFDLPDLNIIWELVAAKRCGTYVFP